MELLRHQIIAMYLGGRSRGCSALVRELTRRQLSRVRITYLGNTRPIFHLCLYRMPEIA